MLLLRSTTLAAALSAAILTSFVPARAQSNGPAIQIVVDGSKTPAAIPDTVAYEHFFTVLATRQGTTTASNEPRRQSYLRFFFKSPCSGQADDRTLTDDQKTKLIAAAEGVMAQVVAIEQQMASGGRTTALLQQRDQVLSAAIASLPSNVDVDAAAKVQRHVAYHVKAHIMLIEEIMPTS